MSLDRVREALESVRELVTWSRPDFMEQVLSDIATHLQEDEEREAELHEEHHLRKVADKELTTARTQLQELLEAAKGVLDAMVEARRKRLPLMVSRDDVMFLRQVIQNIEGSKVDA